MLLAVTVRDAARARLQIRVAGITWVPRKLDVVAKANSILFFLTCGEEITNVFQTPSLGNWNNFERKNKASQIQLKGYYFKMDMYYLGFSFLNKDQWIEFRILMELELRIVPNFECISMEFDDSIIIHVDLVVIH